MKGMTHGYGNKKMYGSHTKAKMGKGRGTRTVSIKSPMSVGLTKDK